jgi:hypothetical protein
MEERKTELEIQALEAAAARGGLTPDKIAELKRDYGTLDLLDSGIGEIEQIYSQSFKGGGLGALQEYAPGWMRPENQSLEDAGNRLSAYISKALGLSGQQFNTPAEQQRFVDSYLPKPGDRDAVIERKITALRTLLASARQTGQRILGNGQQGQPGLSPPDPRVGVGDIGFSGIKEDPRPTQGGTPPAAVAESQAAFENGASVDELLAIARKHNLRIDAAYTNSIREAVRRRDRGQEGGRFIGATPQPDTPPDISDMRGGGGVGEVADATVRNLADVLTLGSADEIAATANTIFRGGTWNENLAREEAVTDFDWERHPFASAAGSIGGALLLPTRVPTTISAAAKAGLRGGVGRGEAIVAGYKAGAGRAAKESGAYGLGYGFLGSEGDVGERLVGAGTTVPLSAAFGYAGTRGLGKVAARYGTRGADEATTAAKAARDLDIDLIRADVGGPAIRRVTAAFAQTPFGSTPIVQGAQRTVDQAGRARDRIAAGVGAAVEPEAAGQTAKAGAMRYRADSRVAVGRAYDRAAELAGDAKIDPVGARGALERNIAELSESPMGAPQQLVDLRERLDGNFTVAGLRNLRTGLRDEFATQGLRGTDIERRAMQTVDALTEDIATGLTRQGRGEAAIAYRAADQLHRERIDMIDNFLTPLIGKKGEKSGEEVVRSLQQAMKGNAERVSGFIRALPEEDASTVRASLINQLGRARSGSQNAEGTVFSLDEFLTNWDQVKGSRERIFGPDTTAALNKLATVANRVKQTGRYANRSNTGSVLATGGTLAPGVSVTGGGAVAFDPVTISIVAAAQYITGHLLASPKAARRLANMPDKPASAKRFWQGAWVAKLAKAEPAIAADLLGLQQSILGSLGGDQNGR